MKFIDEVRIEVRAGHGGPGCIGFRREKFVPRGGPNGGDGGRGGHVILVADTNKNTLLELALTKRLFADNGQGGMGSDCHGKNGEDIFMPVPVGTLVKDEEGSILFDLNYEGCQAVLARGGRGGLGNSHFTTSTNRAPRYAQPGEEGEEGIRIIELRVMADVGLVGLPNAGKSTLLSRISNARPKIADYPFTTLAPMLGQVQSSDTDGFVVADIPGLIEGAHEGKGLGDRFLRHIERTRLLLHLVDAADLDERTVADQVQEVEHELRGYSPTMMHKPRILVLNKMDALSEELRAERIAEVEALELPWLAISAHSGEGLPPLIRACQKQLDKMANPEAHEDEGEEW